MVLMMSVTFPTRTGLWSLSIHHPLDLVCFGDGDNDDDGGDDNGNYVDDGSDNVLM